jgi:hypothetical protein
MSSVAARRPPCRGVRRATLEHQRNRLSSARPAGSSGNQRTRQRILLNRGHSVALVQRLLRVWVHSLSGSIPCLGPFRVWVHLRCPARLARRPRRQTRGATIAAGVVAVMRRDERGLRPGEERCGGSHLFFRGLAPPCARTPTEAEPVVWFQAPALSRAY